MLSKLIEELKAVQAAHGDVECVDTNDDPVFSPEYIPEATNLPAAVVICKLA